MAAAGGGGLDFVKNEAKIADKINFFKISNLQRCTFATFSADEHDTREHVRECVRVWRWSFSGERVRERIKNTFTEQITCTSLLSNLNSSNYKTYII